MYFSPCGMCYCNKVMFTFRNTDVLYINIVLFPGLFCMMKSYTCIVLVRKDMDVNEHEILSNFTLRNKLR
jgi:hypothetical protein